MKNALTLVGSLVGITVFFVVALLPAMAYGGYAGLLLANGLGFAHRLLVVFGMALGIMGVGSLFAVLGAITGALLSVTMERAALVHARMRR